MATRKHTRATVTGPKGATVSATIVQHPNTSPAAVWLGAAPVNRVGAMIARDMLRELESFACEDEGPSIAERSDLENWPRQGRPFRNVVAEYAARATAAGPDTLKGFYAILSDFVSITCQGSVPDAERYDSFCDELARQAQDL